MTETLPLSRAYQEAVAYHKNVLYICARGTTRSTMTARFAQRRGEVGSTSLDGGYNALYHEAGKNEQEVLKYLTTLIQKNLLRVFEDNTREFRWINQVLLALVAKGEIEQQSYEVISLEQVKQELAAAGQLLQFFESFNYSFFND